MSRYIKFYKCAVYCVSIIYLSKAIKKKTSENIYVNWWSLLISCAYSSS